MSNVQLGRVTASLSEPVAAPVAAAGISAGTTAPAQSAAGAPSAAALLIMARQVGETLKARAAGLDYRIDMIAGTPRVRVIDTHSGQVVRQFPSDEILSVYQALDRGEGVFVSRKG